MVSAVCIVAVLQGGALRAQQHFFTTLHVILQWPVQLVWEVSSMSQEGAGCRGVLCAPLAFRGRPRRLCPPRPELLRLGMESSQPQAAEAQRAWDGFPSCPDRVPSSEGRPDASGREDSAPLGLPAGSPPGETSASAH